ncbi:carboxypeptidase-like regulatory domain-containing protein [Aurantibacter sp.]|uniref:carboxypeptidase-like regulatory domain-containing protein n=1 Tax=Aurantibacter sp. TaxID=2807103 RepID=UPI0035C83095
MTSLAAQNSERILIKGRVSVDIPEIEGVTIYNATTKKGVITDAKGEFEIEVTVNDRLDISALLYQNFSIQISKEDVKQREIIIYLIESINTLDEVVILRYGLSGFLNKDLEQLRVVKPVTMSSNLDDYTDLEMADDQFSSVENIATKQGVYYNMVDGRELVKLISKLFTKNKKSNSNIPEVAITLEDKYNNKFYTDNFKIPLDKIQAFIVYVEDSSFNNLLLLPENEMELIELLNTKSQQFLTKKQK